LEWAIPRTRRAGGARAGGFPGAETILQQLADGASRRRVGFKPEGRAPVRGGAALFRGEHDTAPAGVVTSGGFAPSLNAPVSMGYVARDAASTGARLFAEVRGKRHAVMVSELPFVPPHYKR
jgi:aminomethyltransferase